MLEKFFVFSSFSPDTVRKLSGDDSWAILERFRRNHNTCWTAKCEYNFLDSSRFVSWWPQPTVVGSLRNNDHSQVRFRHSQKRFFQVFEEVVATCRSFPKCNFVLIQSVCKDSLKEAARGQMFNTNGEMMHEVKLKSWCSLSCSSAYQWTSASS